MGNHPDTERCIAVDIWRRNLADACRADLPPGGHPLHGILDGERAAIVELFEAWGEIDRSHRKLAHCGSRIGLVHVSESTVRRVLHVEDLVLPGNPPREPIPRRPWPDWLEWKPTGSGGTPSRASPSRASGGGDPGHRLP